MSDMLCILGCDTGMTLSQSCLIGLHLCLVRFGLSGVFWKHLALNFHLSLWFWAPHVFGAKRNNGCSNKKTINSLSRWRTSEGVSQVGSILKILGIDVNILLNQSKTFLSLAPNRVRSVGAGEQGTTGFFGCSFGCPYKP